MDSPKRKHDDVEPEKLSSAELLSTITDIMKGSGNEKDKIRTYRKKYPNFAEGYPVLFEMVCNKGFDFERFRSMLMLKDSVEQGNISQHDASVKVGKVLYDAYVKDKIEPPPKQK